jgi:hypothetical protein
MDLLPLRPVGGTLRLFTYKMDDFNLDILDTIPDVFPYLTALRLIVRRTATHWQSRRHYAPRLLYPGGSATGLTSASSSQSFSGENGKPAGAIISCLQELKELIAADPFSDKTGVASHIRSFTLSLGGFRTSLVSLLENNVLPFLLQKLHHRLAAQLTRLHRYQRRNTAITII